MWKRVWNKNCLRLIPFVLQKTQTKTKQNDWFHKLLTDYNLSTTPVPGLKNPPWKSQVFQFTPEISLLVGSFLLTKSFVFPCQVNSSNIIVCNLAALDLWLFDLLCYFETLNSFTCTCRICSSTYPPPPLAVPIKIDCD